MPMLIDRSSPVFRPASSSLLSAVPECVEDLRRSLNMSYARFSFDRSLTNIVEYLRQILVENFHERFYLQLFEEIIFLRGLTAVVVDRLKGQMFSADNTASTNIRDDSIVRMEKSLRSIKTIIGLHRGQISSPLLLDSIAQYQTQFEVCSMKIDFLLSSI
jgi:hypothetical protein